MPKCVSKKNSDDIFFPLISEMLVLSHECASQLDALLASCDRVHERVERIDETESKADHLLHCFAKTLKSKNLKRKKKEKLSKLTHLIDDLTDSIEMAANIVEMLNISKIVPGMLELSSLILNATDLLVYASKELPAPSDKLLSYVVSINRMEEEGDRIFHSEMKALFTAKEIDVLDVIRFKELFEALESVLDCCEDIADKFEAMALKLV